MRLFACTALAAVAGVALAAAPASAHVILDSSAPRSQNDGLTQAPCGGVAPTNNPTVYQAGSTITVKWTTDIDHQGTYRIAFSPANDQGFAQNILADNIPDQGTSGLSYSYKVTLPSTPCTGCTLQLLQKGTDIAPPAHYYYSCADITLTAASTTDGGQNSGPDAGASGTVDAGSYSVDAGSGGGMPDAPPPADYVDAGSGSYGSGNMSGGCAVAAGAAGSRGAGAGALSLVGLTLAAVWLRRRDRTAARG